MTFEVRTFLLSGTTPLTPADLIDGLVDVHDQMKTVIDDIGIWEIRLDSSLVSSCPVDADCDNPGPLFFGELLEE